MEVLHRSVGYARSWHLVQAQSHIKEDRSWPRVQGLRGTARSQRHDRGWSGVAGSVRRTEAFGPNRSPSPLGLIRTLAGPDREALSLLL